MQYLVNVLDGGVTGDEQTSGRATEAEMAAIDTFNNQLRRDGHWVFPAGLAAPEHATVVDNRGDAGLVTDGPSMQTREFVAGIWIWDASDADVALRLAEKASKACNRRLEIRPVL